LSFFTEVKVSSTRPDACNKSNIVRRVTLSASGN
jgi:hypothetical protein